MKMPQGWGFVDYMAALFVLAGAVGAVIMLVGCEHDTVIVDVPDPVVVHSIDTVVTFHTDTVYVFQTDTLTTFVAVTDTVYVDVPGPTRVVHTTDTVIRWCYENGGKPVTYTCQATQR